MENTRDLSEFGYVEKDEAANLLKAHGSSKDDTQFLGEGVAVEFNPMSGCVFLVDEDYNVAMMFDDRLEDFHTCPNCGGEGVSSEFREQNDRNDCCIEYANELGLDLP